MQISMVPICKIPRQTPVKSDRTALKIGDRRFVDGSVRSVYLEADGRQFVVGDYGAKIFGMWLPSPDRPKIDSFDEGPLSIEDKAFQAWVRNRFPEMPWAPGDDRATKN
jgi:hypothetical protein